MAQYDLWLELIGYAASALVAASLMMADVVRLRRWNLVGSLTFSLYGALIGAWPVFAVNFFIGLVNAWHILRLRRASGADERLDRRTPGQPVPAPSRLTVSGENAGRQTAT